MNSHGALGLLVALVVGLQWACEPCPTLPADDDDETAADDDDDSEADDDVADDDDTVPWDDPSVWRDLSAGLFDACGIRGDGVLACWGEDRGGQAATPTGNGFRMVVMGHEHGCALDVDGVITCWGCQGEDIGDQGQCDPPEGRFVHIDAGEGNNCALDEQGAMVCWGDNNWGQNDPPEGPFTTMSTYFGHTCGIYPDGSMQCWGEGYFGQTEVPDGYVFTQVGVSDWTTYSIDDQGRFLCWGRKECDDADDHRWMDLSIYTTAVCGVTVEGVPDCFGYNVGDRTKEPEGLEATQVAAGHNFACALTPDGEIVCWGCGECPDDPSNQPFDCGDFGQCTPPPLDSF